MVNVARPQDRRRLALELLVESLANREEHVLPELGHIRGLVLLVYHFRGHTLEFPLGLPVLGILLRHGSGRLRVARRCEVLEEVVFVE